MENGGVLTFLCHIVRERTRAPGTPGTTGTFRTPGTLTAYHKSYWSEPTVEIQRSLSDQALGHFNISHFTFKKVAFRELIYSPFHRIRHTILPIASRHR